VAIVLFGPRPGYGGGVEFSFNAKQRHEDEPGQHFDRVAVKHEANAILVSAIENTNLISDNTTGTSEKDKGAKASRQEVEQCHED
jgi:hypothetical protein